MTNESAIVICQFNQSTLDLVLVRYYGITVLRYCICDLGLLDLGPHWSGLAEFFSFRSEFLLSIVIKLVSTFLLLLKLLSIMMYNWKGDLWPLLCRHLKAVRALANRWLSMEQFQITMTDVTIVCIIIHSN